MTQYAGNPVAYGSGGIFQAVMQVTDDGGNTGTTTNVHYTYQVYSNVDLSDSSNRITWTDPWGAGNANNSNINHPGSGGQSTVAGPYTGTAGTLQYGGGNTIHFRFSISGLAGASGTSTVEFDYPLPARVPSAPTPPAVSVDSATGSSVHVFATYVPGTENGSAIDLLNYRLHRVSDGAWIGDLTGGWEGVTFTGLAPVTQYDAYVQARNGVGWSAFSGPVRFGTAATTPGAPSVGVDTITTNTARLYVAATGSDGGSTAIDVRYRIHRSSDNAFLGDLIGSYAGVTFGLVRATSYAAYARVRNAVGEGAWSAAFFFSTLAEAPTIANGYLATAITRNSASITGLSVTDNGGSAPTNVRVQYSTVSGDATGAIVTRGAWADPTITGLTALTTYYYRLSAANSAGWGAWGSWKSFTTLSDAPNDMAAPTFSSITDTSFRASWVAPAMNGATFVNYRYEVSLTDAFATLVASGTTTALFVDVTGVISGTRYYVRVRANATPNNGGYGLASTTTTGIAPQSGLRVYACIEGVLHQGTLYTFVGGVPKLLRPMVVIGGAVQTE